MGGAGDYFSVADRVVQMADYTPVDVTDRAREISNQFGSERRFEGGRAFGAVRARIPLPEGLRPFRRGGKAKISGLDVREILFGALRIDLGDVEQVIDLSQTRALGQAVFYATRYMNGNRTLRDVVERVEKDLDGRGLDILTPYVTGDLARFRALDLAAVINRVRSLKMLQKNESPGTL
jgi:predicted ABC-class ATPase